MKGDKAGISSIDEYIGAFPEEIQEKLVKLRGVIKATAPQVKEKISYQIPTFELNGRNLIHFAGWKTHISIHPIPSGSGTFNREISQFVAGKGTLKFPLNKSMPFQLIGEIVKLLVEDNLKRTGQIPGNPPIKESLEMKKITPFLWFDDQAEEAMRFYVSIFKNSKVGGVTRGPDGRVFSVSFELDGQEFMGLNAGPKFKFNESISMYVNCKDQAEVDELWSRLTADGGEESMCGWLKDKYGLSWQIIPKQLGELMGDPDPAKSQRVMQAMLKMTKIDIAGLRQAYEQE